MISALTAISATASRRAATSSALVQGSRNVQGAAAPVHGQHLHLVLGREVTEPETDAEPVELGLGQGIGTVVLHGILGGDDEEGIAQTVHSPVDRDLMLAHSLEQGRLGARGGPVNLVGKQDVREHGPLVKTEYLFLLVEHGHAENVGRQQIGRELDALEDAAHGAGQRLGQSRLPGPGHILDQCVHAPGESRETQAHRLGLAGDHPADVGGEGEQGRACLSWIGHR